jgi:hypothetical protein
MAALVADSVERKSVPGGLGMARHELQGYRDRRPPRPVFIILVLGLWLALGLVSQAAFQLLG